MLISIHDKLITTTIVKLKCDYNTSSNCKNVWNTTYRVCLSTRLKRNGLDCCNKCASNISNSGDKNPSFKYLKNEKYFKENITENQIYLLGWIAADGSIRERTLHLELNKKDEKILNFFIKNISPQTKITTRKRNKNIKYITISSKEMIKDICDALNINFGNKQNKIRLPKINNINWFIRGFFEGDGWIYKHKTGYRCGIATICPLLQNDLIEISDKLNIKCYRSKNSINWSGKNAEKFLDFIYKDASIFLNRKYRLYLKMKLFNMEKK